MSLSVALERTTPPSFSAQAVAARPPIKGKVPESTPSFGTQGTQKLLAPLKADTFTPARTRQHSPAFGRTAASDNKKIRTLETIVVRRLTKMDDELADSRDFEEYMDGSKPFLRTLKKRYEYLPRNIRDSLVGPHATAYNIRNRVKRGKDSGIIYKEEELSDILFFLYEANKRAEQGDKRFANYPKLNLQLPEKLVQQLDLMVATKPLPEDQQFYDEIAEFLEELTISGKRKNQLNNLFLHSDVIDEKALDKIAKLADLPELNEKELYQFNYLKMSMRDSLWKELPGQANYDYRKLITKPLERLLAAEFFTPKTATEKMITGLQYALWSKLIAPVDQVPPPSAN